MAIEAILFDCDGVLVDSEIVGLADSVRYLQDHGFSWTAEDLIRQFTGMRMDLFQDGLRTAYGQFAGRAPSDEEFTAFFTGFLETRRAQRHTMTTVSGAMETVQAAAQLWPGYLAVASSSGQAHLDSKIERYGFGPFFGQHVYSADAVTQGKPAPDIFLWAADRVGSAPEACLVIEDSPNGVKAGVAAGAQVWGFTGGGHCFADHADKLQAAGAHRVISDHGELIKALAML